MTHCTTTGVMAANVAVAAAAMMVLCATAAGAILLPSHIASSMVLQHGVPVNIWGIDQPGATVSAVFQVRHW